MYINGKWVQRTDSDGIEVRNPSNGEKIAVIPRGTKDDVDSAVKAADAAFRGENWRNIKAFERGEILFDIADKIKVHRDELAELESDDVCKPLSQAYAYV